MVWIKSSRGTRLHIKQLEYLRTAAAAAAARTTAEMKAMQSFVVKSILPIEAMENMVVSDRRVAIPFVSTSMGRIDASVLMRLKWRQRERSMRHLLCTPLPLPPPSPPPPRRRRRRRRRHRRRHRRHLCKLDLNKTEVSRCVNR